MRRWVQFSGVVVLLVLLGAVSVLGARERRRHEASQPGVFDYYVFALSWSPEFCYSHRDRPECVSGHRGFVVHGLWPQFVHGYPEHCSNEAGLADAASVSDIMPDAGLVEHEWTTHGTCSGLDAEHYFKLIRQALGSVKIPARYASPARQFSITPGEIKEDFLQANPGLRADELTVSCGNNYLTGVSVCMTKTLEPTACQSLRDCAANTVRVPAVK